MDRSRKSILVVGLGNPLLGDDGVGWCAAEAVREALTGTALESVVEVDCLALGGLSLMERLIGYDQAILIDAISTGQQPAGSVICCSLAALPDRAAGHLSAAHDTSLQTALRVGRLLGAALPEAITVVAVEAAITYDFSETLSQAVAAAVSHAARRVLNLLLVGHKENAYGIP